MFADDTNFCLLIKIYIVDVTDNLNITPELNKVEVIGAYKRAF